MKLLTIVMALALTPFFAVADDAAKATDAPATTDAAKAPVADKDAAPATTDAAAK